MAVGLASAPKLHFGDLYPGFPFNFSIIVSIFLYRVEKLTWFPNLEDVQVY